MAAARVPGDGTLFVTLGERQSYATEAQSLDSQLGKVVRIHPDGRLPADNPFAAQGGLSAAVWSYGHRNPRPRRCTRRPANSGSPSTGPRAATK